MYQLLLSNRARKDLDRLQGVTWRRVRDALLVLGDEPRPHGCRKLQGGDNTYRIRIGDYRAVYDIDDATKTVTVQRVRHRREIYRDL